MPDISWEVSAGLARHADTDTKDPFAGIFKEAAAIMDSGAGMGFFKILFTVARP